MNPYENLANAVILQAVKGYRDVLAKQVLYPNDYGLLVRRRELETFFQSGWFACLTDLDGKALMLRIQNDVCSMEVSE